MILSAYLLLAGAAVPEISDFARQGDFAVQQIITDDAAALLREWNGPDHAGRPPIIDRIGREKVVDSFIVFTGCTPNPVNQCNVTADFTLIGPQGQVYARHRDTELWVGKAPPAGGALTLSDASLGIFIDPEDPAGDYVVRARVTDHVAGITLRTEKRLTVVEGD
ncbi:MAG: hypothetical protein QHC65_17420 [Sphingomonas sp.]|nr:hypothetical protein [Sphingomonas sp.]MDX3886205.1 hypothetical protein [Sphingomonas sp.]